ncbi:kinesin-like protein KIF22-B [Acropora palmata]|uniref:kinesin-like protein KIF22-B n=1 Tax=Acropora palmata TaxID=6131 RepID=UPI003DA1B53D
MASAKKGCKVRVLVRLRPECTDFLDKASDARNGNPDNCVRAVDASTLEVWNCRNPDESIQYRFNAFFDNQTSQETLYHNSVCPLIPFLLQGHNASVFAYGSTGAGKTHTIVGTPQEPGLIPQCAAELFKVIDAQQQLAPEWKFKVLFSFLEIYQEKIKDLLNTKKDDLPIRQDRQQNIIIPNLTEKPVASLMEYMTLFEKASQLRKTAATKLNPRSSRSHVIVLIKVQMKQQVAPFTKLSGKLHLIDLAGSEDNRRTGNEGVRLKESGAINSSLFALSQVVDALNQGLARIPYRNSKLTRLLQDSLGGSAHACLIANIAPECRFYADTINTLNFASKSRTVINQPFVRQTVDTSLAFSSKRGAAESPSEREPKLLKVDHYSKEIKDVFQPLGKPVSFHLQLTLPAGALGTLVRDEQRKLEDRLTALEKLAQKNSPSSTDKNTTCKQLPKEISNRQPNQVSSPSRIARSPLKDLGNSSSTQEIIYIKDSPQSKDIFVITPHSERKSGFTVDENYKVKINSSVKETHNKEILSVLNNGSIKDLKKLQGVGEKRAQLIVDWRNAHGPFQQIHDLKYISGFTDNMVSTFLKNNLLTRIIFS